MRTFIIMLLLLMLFAGVAQAETYNTRLLIHGQKTVGESQFGVAGWVIAPNVTSSSTWVNLVGPCYDGEGWGVELLGGMVVADGKGKLLLDTRLEFTPKLWGVPVYSWHNFQWVMTGETGTGYWYSQVDWVMPLGLGLLGVETENTFNSQGNDYSVAPHLALPLGDHLALVFAPQFHFNQVRDYTGFQFWFRAVVNF
ncbi:MAG: hypothetical protein US42_C0008G0014 [Candidatus Magasanikbacteria bacterium GW2011_GWC2_37_14]|uniref:Uncharacterized protein n=1 Tax=Candidatus Magasanikbacteria bacterium GW2011_GWC2_37_14 TaxID=1619046 RepID=A0A0G0G8S5_9BACT|nr:MAG: hypothetical protein US42_C0008G0014 [Candidatus Magasanikbacteria bacterium GW2011_GWC2_37_14]